MKFFFIFFIFFIFITSSVSVYAKNKAVYGPIDNRQNINDVKNPMLYQLARSTFAKVDSDFLKPLPNDLFHLIGYKLGESRAMCKDERFLDEPMSASCTGFLVAKDIILTAGHCVRNQDTCGDESWVLDFTKNNYNIKKENIFKCSKILSRHLDYQSEFDYAIIKLNRVVKNRTIFKLRKNGIPQKSSKLAVMGYPSGLPLKVANNGTFRDMSNKFFYKTTLDSFHGNSGSPVINMETGLVEGILTQGEDDYIIDYPNNCRRVRNCKIDQCRGEDITKITLIPQNLIK